MMEKTFMRPTFFVGGQTWARAALRHNITIVRMLSNLPEWPGQRSAVLPDYFKFTKQRSTSLLPFEHFCLFVFVK